VREKSIFPETFKLFQAKIYAKYFQDYTFHFNMKTAPPVSCACMLVAIGIMWFFIRYRHKGLKNYYFRFFADSRVHTPPRISAIKAIAEDNGDFVVGTGVGCIIAGSAFKVA